MYIWFRYFTDRRMPYSPPPSAHHSLRKRKIIDTGRYEGSSSGREYHHSSTSSTKRDCHYRIGSGRSNDYESHHYRHNTSSSNRRYATSPSSPSHLRSNARKQRRAHSPASPPPPSLTSSRMHSLKRHSRSRSPSRYGRGQSSPFYSVNRSSRARSPSMSPLPNSKSIGNNLSSSRKMDFNNKISDTSLFAELVKDKHKRDKVLQELKERREDAVTTVENVTVCAPVASPALTIGANVDYQIDSTINKGLIQMLLEGSDNAVAPTANGAAGVLMKDDCLLVDIPMPRTADTVDGDTPIVPLNAPPSITNDTLILDHPSIPVINSTSSNVVNVQAAVAVIKTTYTIAKPRNLTKLPMPPGVSVTELDDTTTPSPPRSVSPVISVGASTAPPLPSPAVLLSSQQQIAGTASHKLHQHKLKDIVAPPGRKGLLNLPMPPMVPGSEDLSGDDDIIGSPSRSPKKDGGNSDSSTVVKRKRPTILNRRNSRSALIKDWGERSVDVFQVIAQIGEGTYGQVSSNFYFYFSLCTACCLQCTLHPVVIWCANHFVPIGIYPNMAL